MTNPTTPEQILERLVLRFKDENLYLPQAEGEGAIQEALTQLEQLIRDEVIGTTKSAFDTYGPLASHDDHARLQTYDELRTVQRQALHTLFNQPKVFDRKENG